MLGIYIYAGILRRLIFHTLFNVHLNGSIHLQFTFKVKWEISLHGI